MSETSTAPMTLRQWLQAAPFGLAMSSGFFGFFAHCGMLSALEAEGLLPHRVSGSSAGALVAGCWASGASAAQLSERLCALKRQDFWDLGLGLGLLKGRLFRQELEQLVGADMTMEACRVPIALSLYDLKARATVVASEGPLASAIHASCALPFLFQPVERDGRKYLDGGIADRPGLMGMPDDARTLYHHMASKSPWRRRNSPALQLPQRDGLVSLAIHGLPRVNPFKLHKGVEAFQMAQAATTQALDMPLTDNAVQLHLDAPQLG